MEEFGARKKKEKKKNLPTYLPIPKSHGSGAISDFTWLQYIMIYAEDIEKKSHQYHLSASRQGLCSVVERRIKF
jgi:hypothetical protein